MAPLVELAIIWGGVFVALLAAKHTRLTPVLYFLAVGAIMVNLGILPKESSDFIRIFAEVGIIIIMFALGFEEETGNFLSSIKRTWGIAFFGALAPFAVAYGIAWHFWQDANIALMMGLTMTATAVSLTMVSLKNEGLNKSRAATGIMTSAVLDDIASLFLVAILVPIATGSGAMGIVDMAAITGKAILFFVFITILGAWIFPHQPRGFISKVPILRRFGVMHLLGFDEGEHATLSVLTIALVVGLLAHEFGFHPAVGAYMAGLVLKKEYFKDDPVKRRNAYQRTLRNVENAAFSWIGPIFFIHLGTKIVFDWDIMVAVIPQTILLLVALIIAQVSSAALAARYTGGFDKHESVMIGLGMLGRAELAFVVMDIAYVQNKILDDHAFYTLMFTAFWLNIAVPIAISKWKPYYINRPGATEEETAPEKLEQQQVKT